MTTLNPNTTVQSITARCSNINHLTMFRSWPPPFALPISTSLVQLFSTPFVQLGTHYLPLATACRMLQ